MLKYQRRNNMAEEEVKLTFDLNPFKKAIQQAGQMMGNFAKNATQAVGKVASKIPLIGKLFKKNSDDTQKTAKGTSKGIMSAFGKLAGIGAVVAVGFGAIKKAMDSIPEIGMTFKAVGDIIGKNLLWPLRQELIPILQKVLDWVRNNRAMFVKWGGVLVNVFRMIKVIFKTAWNLVKSFTKGLMDTLKGLLKFAGKDITDVINLLIFKLTAIFAVLEVKLAPFFEFLGKGMGKLVMGFKDFFKFLERIGALEKMRDILKDIGHLVKNVLVFYFNAYAQAIKNIIALFSGFTKGLGEVKGLGKGFGDTWKTVSETMNKVVKLFTKLVQIIGPKLTPMFKTLGNVIGKTLGKALKGLMSILEGVFGIFSKILDKALGALEGVPTTSGGGGGRTTRVNDAIIRPDGSIVQTNPQDTLVALKNPQQAMSNVSGKSGGPVTIQVGDINLNVTEGNAKQAGMNFAMGLQDQMRQIIMDQRVLEGGR